MPNPKTKKTPRDDRLRQWYIDMLIECQRRGIVGKLTNMYDLYFSGDKCDASAVPYMDGDYFPAEVENIIKNIEEGKTGKKSAATGKKKKNDNKAKSKTKGRGGTRSTGLDEEALAASGIMPVGIDQKSLEEGGRDYVMVKLGETIEPMKLSFIVAFLAWEHAKPEDMEVPKEIQEYREQHGIVELEKKSDESPFATEATDKGIKSGSTHVESVFGVTEDPLKSVAEIVSVASIESAQIKALDSTVSSSESATGINGSLQTTAVIRGGKVSGLGARKKKEIGREAWGGRR